MTGATVFSKIDLNKGYHQLELHPNSRPITTFRTHQGLYRYKRLSFGINSAAEIFPKKIAEVIQNIPGAKNISDDIIYTKEEDIDTPKAVFARLRAHNLKVNKVKRVFGVSSLEFFGHVCQQKVSLSAIIEAEPPITVSELLSYWVWPSTWLGLYQTTVIWSHHFRS